jgi:hypothetical protein
MREQGRQENSVKTDRRALQEAWKTSLERNLGAGPGKTTRVRRFLSHR